MLESLQVFNGVFGIEVRELSVLQVGARAAVIYIFGLLLLRIVGDRRFVGRYAAFDFVLSIILGSTLSRAINSNVSFYGTMLAGLVLVGLHWLVAEVSTRSSRFDVLVKGKSHVLIRDGQVQWRTLKKSHLTPKDLDGILHSTAKVPDPEQVAIARLESSGQISAIPKKNPPQVIEVSVEDNVQTIKIRLDP